MRSSDDNNNFFIHSILGLHANDKLREMDHYMQHGNTSTFSHCLTVAYISYRLTLHLPFRFNKRSVIRGAMLHDFYLYDWHIPHKSHRLHGFRHPRFALINAKQCCPLSPIEEDIIQKHMWPLTITRYPIYKESMLVCFVDKFCSLAETLHIPLKSNELRQVKASLNNLN